MSKPTMPATAVMPVRAHAGAGCPPTPLTHPLPHFTGPACPPVPSTIATARPHPATKRHSPVTDSRRPGWARHRRRQSRTPVLYVIVIAAWAALAALLVQADRSVAHVTHHHDLMLAVTAANTLFIAYFWLNGLKDIAYPAAYRLMRRRQVLTPRRPPGTGRPPVVGLLYVTCNDFSAASLDASIRQDYALCAPIICDDSSDPAFHAQVDAYAREHGIPVIRRADRSGFKAGNLNNCLRGYGRHLDYFVIIDSDEILPPEFVNRALDYFADDPATGIVQANHIATRNRTTFMRTFAPGVDSHWPAYQSVKSRAGFLSLLGHGAMVSREAYLAAGGFPHIVAEDIGFAIDAARAGYRTVFAPDITCEEEFPPDYAAFKKRHRKWTEGNMEFIRRYTGRILFRRGLAWYERLDIVLFTYSLPLTGLFSLYVAANSIVFPLLGVSSRYPLWMLVPTGCFLLAPMLNDVLTWAGAPKGRLASYLLHSVALFGSVYFVSLTASLRTMFGRSVFNVTPKTAQGTGLRAAFRQNAKELAAGVILATLVAGASGSVLPVILLLIPVTFGMYLSVMNAGDEAIRPASDQHIFQGRTR
jgi:cellulose synthase/poly-beta-1,6-N-acetylglucosamine synthase-like glycosyltransferase